MSLLKKKSSEEKARMRMSSGGNYTTNPQVDKSAGDYGLGGASNQSRSNAIIS